MSEATSYVMSEQPIDLVLTSTDGTTNQQADTVIETEALQIFPAIRLDELRNGQVTINACVFHLGTTNGRLSSQFTEGLLARAAPKAVSLAVHDLHNRSDNESERFRWRAEAWHNTVRGLCETGVDGSIGQRILPSDQSHYQGVSLAMLSQERLVVSMNGRDIGLIPWVRVSDIFSNESKDTEPEPVQLGYIPFPYLPSESIKTLVDRAVSNARSDQTISTAARNTRKVKDYRTVANSLLDPLEAAIEAEGYEVVGRYTSTAPFYTSGTGFLRI
jgi:hypothetical protein